MLLGQQERQKRLRGCVQLLTSQTEARADLISSDSESSTDAPDQLPCENPSSLWELLVNSTPALLS